METREHRRFVEFCNSCRRSQYIGLCYGPPGTGKTLSARRYSRADLIRRRERWSYEPIYGAPLDTALYTPDVVNTPAQILTDIRQARSLLSHLARGPLNKQEEIALETIRLRDEHYHRTHRNEPDYKASQPIPLEPTYAQVAEEYATKRRAIRDPTSLILIDEADRLRMHSIEQLRTIFDEGGFGLIFIGMPGIEKRMARYAQLYSRIGFVHEFRPLSSNEMQQLLDRHWAPAGVILPQQPFDEDTSAAIVRITGGNFRLLTRLLAQIQRVLEINRLLLVTKAVVDTARESLVIGEA